MTLCRKIRRLAGKHCRDWKEGLPRRPDIYNEESLYFFARDQRKAKEPLSALDRPRAGNMVHRRFIYIERDIKSVSPPPFGFWWSVLSRSTSGAGAISLLAQDARWSGKKSVRLCEALVEMDFSGVMTKEKRSDIWMRYLLNCIRQL